MCFRRRYMAGLACAFTLLTLSYNGILRAQDFQHSSSPSAHSYSKTAVEPTAGALDYTTSWIGNSFSGANYGPNQLAKHVPIDIDAVYVTPGGEVYTNTGWDEGGRALSTFKDGNIINPVSNANENIGGADNAGGDAVAADDTYVYQAENGGGIQVKNVSDHSDASVSLTGSSTLAKSVVIPGEVIFNKKLYVSENDKNVVDVFDTATLTLVKSYPIPNPARIAVDSQGGMWISHFSLAIQPPWDTFGTFGLSTIDHYNSSGVLQKSITVPDDAEVTALWIDQHGKDNQDRLFVGDDGPDQNIKIYINILQNPIMTATFGRKGGVYAGDARDRGRVGPFRFHGITGVGTDAHGNIYIGENQYGPSFPCCGSNGRGAVVQSYTLGDIDRHDGNGNREDRDDFNWRNRGSHLNWTLDGLEFVSMTTIDPGTGGDAFDAYHHFHIDWDAGTGKEAKYIADTTDPIRYPDDIRLTNNGPNNGQSGEVWRIRGKRFLFVQSQSGSYIAIYRFDESSAGEVAIPCAGITHGTINGAYLDWVHQPQTGEGIWRDLNGDGIAQSAEFAQPPNTTGRTNGGGLWHVDTDGNIWEIAPGITAGTTTAFRRYLFQGFDQYGAPIYDYDHVDYFDLPSDFSSVSSVQFDPQGSSGGTLYMAGNQYTPEYAGQFTTIARYDHWEQGNRKPSWITTVPWNPDPNNSWQPHQFAFVGHYMFVDYEVPHYILVYRLKDGSYVGQLTPSANVGGPINVGNTDIWQSMAAYQRCDGEYIITNEDDYQAKTLMYRWRAKNLKEQEPPVAPTGLAGTGDDEAADLSWTPVPGALTYQVYRSLTPGGPYLQDSIGIFAPNYVDTGLKNGQTYYYVVSVRTETGISRDSAEAAVTAVAKGTTYEAEASQLANGGSIIPCPKCSGGAKVSGVGPGVTISLTNVAVPAAGTYKVRVYYGNGDNNPGDFSPMDVTSNGGAAIAIDSFPYTGDWGIPAYVAVDVPLKAGNNTIVLGVPAGSPNGGPDIDRILVPFKEN